MKVVAAGWKQKCLSATSKARSRPSLKLQKACPSACTLHIGISSSARPSKGVKLAMTATNFITTNSGLIAWEIGNGVFHPSPISNHCSLENGFPRCQAWHDHPPCLKQLVVLLEFSPWMSPDQVQALLARQRHNALQLHRRVLLPKVRGRSPSVVFMLCTYLSVTEREGRGREREREPANIYLLYKYIISTRRAP